MRCKKNRWRLTRVTFYRNTMVLFLRSRSEETKPRFQIKAWLIPPADWFCSDDVWTRPQRLGPCSGRLLKIIGCIKTCVCVCVSTLWGPMCDSDVGLRHGCLLRFQNETEAACLLFITESNTSQGRNFYTQRSKNSRKLESKGKIKLANIWEVFMNKHVIYLF